MDVLEGGVESELDSFLNSLVFSFLINDNGTLVFSFFLSVTQSILLRYLALFSCDTLSCTMAGKNKRRQPGELPPLTIQGKRDIVAEVIKVRGEKVFLAWLIERNIPSVRYMKEHVRKYKSRVFREMMELL